MKKALSAKQQRFVDEYILDTNAARAARRAGYSQKSADKIGFNLLETPKVFEAIQERLNRLSVKIEVTAEKILQEYAKIAFSNIDDFVEWQNGNIKIKCSNTLSREQKSCVSEISETSSKHEKTVKIKLCDKLTALNKLGEHLNLFKNTVEVINKDDLLNNISDDVLKEVIKDAARAIENTTSDDSSKK